MNKDKGTSTKVPEEFKTFLKRAAVNHGFAKQRMDTLTQLEVQLRIVKYFKCNDDRYIEFINMEDDNA